MVNEAVGNGGKTDRYVWTQTLQELSVVVAVPEGSKSRDVVCDITKSRLRVGIKGHPLLIDVSNKQKSMVGRGGCSCSLESN